MDNLAARTLVLAGAGESNRQNVGPRATSKEVDGGYLIVTFEPRLPSTHSTVAPS